jgi:hypothetical protein
VGEKSGAHVARVITVGQDADTTARSIFEALEAADQITTEPDFDI